MALTDEKKDQKIQCDNCTDENSAATRCEECAVFLCSYCSEFHKKSRPTKHHVLTTLQELKSGAGPLSVAEKIRCVKHKEELIKLYCKTCQSTICRDCTIVEHRTHDYGFIEDVAVGQKEVLKRNMKEVQQRQATLQRAIASLKLFDQSLVDENALVVAQVTSHFEELQRIVVSKKSELLSKASSLTNLKRKQIQAQIEALEVALASCKSSIEFTEKAFKNGNDVQVLSMQKYILQSLQDLKKVKDVTQPCVTRDLRFSIPWSIEDTDKNFLSYFAVDESVADPNQCQAEFTDEGEHLKRDQQTSLKIICFDKNKKRIKNGGQVVEANISGVEYDNATIQDNKDGTHTVNVTPRRGGTLEFKATIDGRPAPRCSLTKDVTWVFSNDHGSGELSDGGLRVRCSNMNYDESCWRIGERSFKSGVQSWKVLFKMNEHRVPTHGRTPARRSLCIVGVTSTADNTGANTYQVRCQHGEELTVTVTLNIPKNSLYFAFESNYNNQSEINPRRIEGEQFWPFVMLRGNGMEAVLKFD
ncbi:tripartite motif-containing 45-like [Paramuricea clavata]|uniref:Tripartite motif-containing 45-like n=1 Tax=Paramuricea clavata TaxID=317549 RepID=A0A6S7II35_PARCT|nr:tripartite motif-containing 45-like [Paramuricea clavata]